MPALSPDRLALASGASRSLSPSAASRGGDRRGERRWADSPSPTRLLREKELREAEPARRSPLAASPLSPFASRSYSPTAASPRWPAFSDAPPSRLHSSDHSSPRAASPAHHGREPSLLRPPRAAPRSPPPLASLPATPASAVARPRASSDHPASKQTEAWAARAERAYGSAQAGAEGRADGLRLENQRLRDEIEQLRTASQQARDALKRGATPPAARPPATPRTRLAF